MFVLNALGRSQMYVWPCLARWRCGASTRLTADPPASSRARHGGRPSPQPDDDNVPPAVERSAHTPAPYYLVRLSRCDRNIPECHPSSAASHLIGRMSLYHRLLLTPHRTLFPTAVGRRTDTICWVWRDYEDIGDSGDTGWTEKHAVGAADVRQGAGGALGGPDGCTKQKSERTSCSTAHSTP